LAELEPPAIRPELIHDANDLVTRNNRQRVARQVALDHVQVRPADRTAVHL
jgi:hypothetical protein